jgi:hypothetical protein
VFIKRQLGGFRKQAWIGQAVYAMLKLDKEMFQTYELISMPVRRLMVLMFTRFSEKQKDVQLDAS